MRKIKCPEDDFERNRTLLIKHATRPLGRISWLQFRDSYNYILSKKKNFVYLEKYAGQRTFLGEKINLITLKKYYFGVYLSLTVELSSAQWQLLVGARTVK